MTLPALSEAGAVLIARFRSARVGSSPRTPFTWDPCTSTPPRPEEGHGHPRLGHAEMGTGEVSPSQWQRQPASPRLPWVIPAPIWLLPGGCERPDPAPAPPHTLAEPLVVKIIKKKCIRLREGCANPMLQPASLLRANLTGEQRQIDSWTCSCWV